MKIDIFQPKNQIDLVWKLVCNFIKALLKELCEFGNKLFWYINANEKSCKAIQLYFCWLQRDLCLINNLIEWKNLPIFMPFFEGECVLRLSRNFWCFLWIRSNWKVILCVLLQFSPISAYIIEITFIIDICFGLKI